MKKIFVILLSILLVTSLFGCQKDPKVDPVEPIDVPKYEVVDGTGKDGLHYHNDVIFTGLCPKDGREYVNGVRVKEQEDNPFKIVLPTIDGSTSLIPLEASLKTHFYDADIETLTNSIKHSSTWDAFYHLIHDQTDILLSVPISDEQREYAKKYEAEFEETPISKEGFVFVVNKDNPVDSLTVQQVKDIYSGKITNWKQVGGNDEEIIPYQRNNDSGSQNYMINFMKGSHLMEVETLKVGGGMVPILDVVASFDGTKKNAIGYTYYSFVSNMYQNSNLLKIVKINDVECNLKNIENETYPLVCFNYMYLKKGSKNYSEAKKFVDWVISKEGQEYVAKGGYATLEDYGYQYPELLYDKFYKGIGTGKVHGTSTLKVYSLSYDPLGDTMAALWRDTIGKIDFLKNKDFEKQINDYIENLIKQDERKYYFINVNCINGYLAVRIYGDNKDSDVNDISIWNIIDSKKCTFEDLFVEGTDITKALAGTVISELNNCENQSYYNRGDIDVVYSGLFKDTFSIDFNTLYLSENNRIFPESTSINFSSDIYDKLVFNYEYDFSDYIITDNLFYRHFEKIFIKDISEYNDTYIKKQLKPESCQAYKQINDSILKKYSEIFSPEKVEQLLKEGYEMDGFLNADFGKVNNYIIAQPNIGPIMAIFPFKFIFIYDGNNGNEVEFNDILKPGWEKETYVRSESTNWQPIKGFEYDLKDFVISSIGISNIYLYIYLIPVGTAPGTYDNYISIDIPKDYIK